MYVSFKQISILHMPVSFLFHLAAVLFRNYCLMTFVFPRFGYKTGVMRIPGCRLKRLPRCGFTFVSAVDGVTQCTALHGHWPGSDVTNLVVVKLFTTPFTLKYPNSTTCNINVRPCIILCTNLYHFHIIKYRSPLGTNYLKLSTENVIRKSFSRTG